MKKALFAGSFDPITLGHLNLIERSAKLFDEVVVGVVVNLEKHSLFTFEERMDMINKVTEHLPNVSADMCDGLLADYVNKNGFDAVIRGIRGSVDLDSEASMAHLHRHLYTGGAETIFLLPDAEVAFISSTMARQVIGLGGDGTSLVPPYVLDRMHEKFAAQGK